MRKQSTALTISELNRKSNELSHTRKLIADIKERLKLELEPLEQVESLLKVDLINGMTRLGTKSITAQSGEAYHIAVSYDFEFKNDGMGMKLEAYAKENNLVRPDKIAVRQSLRAKFEKDALPTGVEAFERQTISVRSAKEDLETKEGRDPETGELNRK